MGTHAAKNHASAAQRAKDTNEKLDWLAKAIAELANALDEISARVSRVGR